MNRNKFELKKYIKISILISLSFIAVSLLFSYHEYRTYNRNYNNKLNLMLDKIQEQYPDRKILVVDTLCASLGQGMLVYLTCKQRQQGKSIDEAWQFAEDTKLHLCHWFTVDDLGHLRRGGRISGATALLGTLLGIKPILHVDDEGHLIPMGKVRGRRAAIAALVEHMAETGIDLEQQEIFISHGDCLADAQELAHQIQARFPVQNIYINFVGPVIGAHSGPGTLALFFLGSAR